MATTAARQTYPPPSGSIVVVLKVWAESFAPFLDEMLAGPLDIPVELRDAVRYAALAPGKRFRPFLVAECCRVCEADERRSWPAAAAIECVHAFSLVHDDLPAMDDDDLRRGRPTCHKVYGEGMAVLAGDALLALAFEILVTRTDPSVDRTALVRELAQAAGWAGMIGGQADDILGERAEPSLERVRRIHDRKTAALIAASCRMGGLCAGAPASRLDALGRYGRHLGLAFQIADDILDETSTPEELGKATTKDADAGKQTYPRVVGMEASRTAAREQIEQAEKALEIFGEKADNLRCLARYVIDRRN